MELQWGWKRALASVSYAPTAGTDLSRLPWLPHQGPREIKWISLFTQFVWCWNCDSNQYFLNPYSIFFSLYKAYWGADVDCGILGYLNLSLKVLIKKKKKTVFFLCVAVISLTSWEVLLTTQFVQCSFIRFLGMSLSQKKTWHPWKVTKHLCTSGISEIGLAFLLETQPLAL